MLCKSPSWTSAEVAKLIGVLRHGTSYADTIVERLPAGIALISRDQQIVYANSFANAFIPDLNSGISVFREHCQCVFQSGIGIRNIESGFDSFQISLHPFDADHILLVIYPMGGGDVGSPLRSLSLVGNSITVAGDSAGFLSAPVSPEEPVMAALERVCGQVAHRFNNLLTVVLAYTDIISSQYKSVDPLKSDLDRITEAAKQMSDLAQDLLVFSHGRPTSPVPVDVDKVISGMANMFQAIAGSTTVNIRVPNQGACVHLAVKELETVLLNLVRNAKEAVRPDASAITIATCKLLPGTAEYETLVPQLGLPPRTYMCLTVADTGTGCSPAHKAHVFEPFFTTKPGASGLGLSVAYGIVKRAGGGVVVETNAGAGTTARVVLPEALL
jgi:signal transduction histidine kinase